MRYREVIIGGAISGLLRSPKHGAEPWLGSDQSSVTGVIQLALTPAFLLTQWPRYSTCFRRDWVASPIEFIY